MKHTTILLLLFPLMLHAQKVTHVVQDYVLNPATQHWQAQGEPYSNPDTANVIHRYKWKREKIVALQDYRRVNGKWAKFGEPYPTPDTLKLVHAFIK